MDGLTMTIDKTNPPVRRYILNGRISSAESNALQHELEEAMRAGSVNFVLNMRQISYLCSAGIRVLLMMYKRTKEQKGSFYVESPSENVINVLGMTALDEMLLK